MRIQITTRDAVTLPLAHHVELQHALYSLVDADQIQVWHENGRAPRPYTFSRLLGKTEIKGHSIHFPRGFSWWIHTHDDDLGSQILRKIQESKVLPLGKQRVAIQRFRSIPTPEVGDQMLIHTLSPIVADDNVDGKIISYSPYDTEFSRHIEQNAMKKLRYFLQREGGAGLTIRPLGGIRKITSWFKTTPIEGYIGTFVLLGEPEMLQLLFNVGLGRRNGIGFGCFELFE